MRVVLRERPLATALIERVLEEGAGEVLDRAVRPEVSRIDVGPVQERSGLDCGQLPTSLTGNDDSYGFIE